MTTTEDQRFAPPQAHVEDVAPDVPIKAGRGVRLLAVIVDTVLAAFAGWAIGRIPAIQPLVLAQQKAALVDGLWHWNMLSLLIGVPVFLLIQGWTLATRGQTIGKMLFKLRIVRSDGSKVDAWRMFGLRYGIGILAAFNTAIGMIYGVLDALMIFRESRKCLHDSIADTQVIKL